ncbi:MAG: archease [Nitrospirae bacterium]|nr:archease [Nitrospirota bacterium]
MISYETFDHEADAGIRGYGKTLEEAFAHGAEALFSLMVDIGSVEPSIRREVSCDAPDPEILFVEWLNHLITEAHLQGMVFSRFQLRITGSELRGEAWGEPLKREKHHPMIEVKGATYSMLKVAREDDRFVAQCVVDV